MMGQIMCICCRRRYSKEMIHNGNDRIGICHTCYEKLDKVPIKSALEGTKSAPLLLTPFYYTGELRSAVIAYKFYGNWLYGEVFAGMIREYVKEFDLPGRYDAIVGIPLSRKRLAQRGYSQVENIAVPLARLLGMDVLNKAVFRTRNTKAQSTLRGLERYWNIRNAFVADRRKIENKRIILVDDVVTYGATMEACARELWEK